LKRKSFGNGKRNFRVVKMRPTEALFMTHKIVCNAKNCSEKQEKAVQNKK
jgi:hypothetical protein